MVSRALTLLAALLLAAPNHAAEPPWVMLAPANHVLPLADVQQGQLRAGILKDLGEALARRLNRPVRFLVMPSKRVGATLASGEADLLCYVRPYWIDGDFLWTQPVIPNTGVIAGRRDSPKLTRVEDLAGRPLGTVAGYRYPQLEDALGPHLARADAPDMASNLAKLAARRMDYVVVERMSLRHALQHHPEWPLVEMLTLNHFEAPCALSRRSRLTLSALKAAIDSLRRDGELQRLLDQAR